MAQTAALQGFPTIAPHAHREAPSGRRPLWELFAEGLSVELSGVGPGKLSVAVRLVARAMQAGEPVVWITPREAATFYPPDLEALGIDLDALTVVRMPESAGGHGLVRAAEVVLRAGAFGLVVVDLSQGMLPRGQLTWQSRLSGLVRLHASRLLLITSSLREAPSIGPLISLRLEPELGAATATGSAVLLQRTLKSKLGMAVDPSPDARCLPAGASAR